MSRLLFALIVASWTLVGQASREQDVKWIMLPSTTVPKAPVAALRGKTKVLAAQFLDKGRPTVVFSYTWKGNPTAFVKQLAKEWKTPRADNTEIGLVLYRVLSSGPVAQQAVILRPGRTVRDPKTARGIRVEAISGWVSASYNEKRRN